MGIETDMRQDVFEGDIEAGARDTRTLILDATEALMLEQGYAGVSSRKVAERAGLRSNLLHYYFKTMDDLFSAVFHRLEDRHDARFASVAASETPLSDLWRLALNAADGKMIVEFTALANHRPAIRHLISRSAGRHRRGVKGALDSIFLCYGIDEQEFPPVVIAMLMAGLSRAISTERELGTSEGHDEALAFAERHLARFEGSLSKARTKR